MQRRQFIELSAVGGTVILFTGVSCRQRNSPFNEVLSQPEQLAQICDLKTLREIGMAYRLQTPTEKTAGKLAGLIMSDSAGNPVSSASDQAFIQDFINKKITQDFETGNLIILKGWILSVTEARQCALLIVNNP